MWPNLQFPADLVTFTEEILNGKFNFLCSEFRLRFPGSRVFCCSCYKLILFSLSGWKKFREMLNIKCQKVRRWFLFPQSIYTVTENLQS